MPTIPSDFRRMFLSRVPPCCRATPSAPGELTLACACRVSRFALPGPLGPGRGPHSLPRRHHAVQLVPRRLAALLEDRRRCGCPDRREAALWREPTGACAPSPRHLTFPARNRRRRCPERLLRPPVRRLLSCHLLPRRRLALFVLQRQHRPLLVRHLSALSAPPPPAAPSAPASYHVSTNTKAASRVGCTLVITTACLAFTCHHRSSSVPLFLFSSSAGGRRTARLCTSSRATRRRSCPSLSPGMALRSTPVRRASVSVFSSPAPVGSCSAVVCPSTAASEPRPPRRARRVRRLHYPRVADHRRDAHSRHGRAQGERTHMNRLPHTHTSPPSLSPASAGGGGKTEKDPAAALLHSPSHARRGRFIPSCSPAAAARCSPRHTTTPSAAGACASSSPLTRKRCPPLVMPIPGVGVSHGLRAVTHSLASAQAHGRRRLHSDAPRARQHGCGYPAQPRRGDAVQRVREVQEI